MSEICGGCNSAIQDQYMFYVLDKSWHGNCLSCHDCKIPQRESCFYRDGLILCKDDFTRRFATRCSGCNIVLQKQDLVRRARNLVFHVDCFRCNICQKKLDTGEQLYVIGGNRFICKDDYLCSSVNSEECGSIDEVDENIHEEDDEISNDPTTPDHQNNSNNQLEMDASTAGSGDDKNDDNSLATKRRGPRTTIKSKQLETLKAAFAATPKPTRHMREQLAAETGLNMRVIQVWFQNRRSKERRMKQSRIACGFRTPRRNRQNGSNRPDGVFCDVMETMQHDPNTAFYLTNTTNNILPPQFFSNTEQLYPNLNNSNIIHDMDTTITTTNNSTFLRNENIQLDSLNTVVNVSNNDYHIEEAIAGLNNASALSVW